MTQLTVAEMEARYDAERSGRAWQRIIPILLDPNDDGSQAENEDINEIIAILEEIDGGEQAEARPASLMLAVADFAEQIEIAQMADQLLADPVVVTRHTVNSDGSIPRDPWTTYDLGDASIDVQDAGGISMYIGQDGLEQIDTAQLRDLLALLADPRVQAAIGMETAPLGGQR